MVRIVLQRLERFGTDLRRELHAIAHADAERAAAERAREMKVCLGVRGRSRESHDGHSASPDFE